MLQLTPRQPPRPPADALRPLAFPRLTKLAGKVLTRWYRVTGKHRYDDFRLERVHGVPLVVAPSVFNPRLPRTGAFLAAHIDAQRVGADAEVLDLGTGCGVCAIFAARFARRVVAIDVNAAAVRCARSNALLNASEGRLEVRHGDLFAPVTGERFDLILFNPPFLRGTASDERDRAWRSPDVAERFAAGLCSHLKPGGCALVVLSTFGGAARFLDEFARQSLAVTVVAQRRFINERLAVLRLRPPGEEVAA